MRHAPLPRHPRSIGPEGARHRRDAPPGLRILDVAHGRVLGVVMDEMDVESVVVYELAGS